MGMMDGLVFSTCRDEKELVLFNGREYPEDT
jgi:hypothetical protein